jgi:hypothetical protein
MVPPGYIRHARARALEAVKTTIHASWPSRKGPFSSSFPEYLHGRQAGSPARRIQRGQDAEEDAAAGDEDQLEGMDADRDALEVIRGIEEA